MSGLAPSGTSKINGSLFFKKIIHKNQNKNKGEVWTRKIPYSAELFHATLVQFLSSFKYLPWHGKHKNILHSHSFFLLIYIFLLDMYCSELLFRAAGSLPHCPPLGLSRVHWSSKQLPWRSSRSIQRIHYAVYACVKGKEELAKQWKQDVWNSVILGYRVWTWKRSYCLLIAGLITYFYAEYFRSWVLECTNITSLYYTTEKYKRKIKNKCLGYAIRHRFSWNGSAGFSSRIIGYLDLHLIGRHVFNTLFQIGFIWL